MNIILASSSPYRRALLERLQLPFSTRSPEVDEAPRAGEAGQELCRRLSGAKAAAIAADHPGAIVIGSDQVPTLDRELLHKPGGAENAFRQLRACSGHRVVFDTGLCVIAPGQELLLDSVATVVQFRNLSDGEIRRYLQLDRPFDCAGSFKWESLGIALFERLEGEDPTALEGLPLIALCRMLRQTGLDPLAGE
jgi:septum formation protein